MLLAKWDILQKTAYLKTLQASMTMGLTLISGFLLLFQNISVRFQEDSATEMKVSILSFLAAPIIVILANAVSLTILASNQDKRDIQQLRTLGVSRKNMILIHMAESFLPTLLVFVTSLLFNLIVLVMVLYGVHLLGYSMLDYTAVFSIYLLVSAVLFV
ncbi:efflux ABC transporter, permease protein [Streptococcus macacae NCTC 11558]|uniref:Efflux ABC transporter, permease protein n=2 Tax=Streptococcus macacae TaxID=1339 RepID=G5JW83_9STRE|nr:efflux ABC transporter, permease protein [Streptococcus macacae NCTC 11558]